MKATAATLSEHLLGEARRFIFYPNRVRRDQDLAKKLNQVLAMFVESQEWAPPSAIGGQKLSPEGLDPFYNEFYCKAFLEKIPKMAERTRTLPTLRTKTPVDRATNLYLREATRSYILGIWDAAVALSRATVEEALEVRLKQTIPGLKGGLDELLKLAERFGVLDREQLSAAGRVQRRGNMVLHTKPATEEDARSAIVDVRSVVTYLYGVA